MGGAIFLTYRSVFGGAEDAFWLANRVGLIFEPLWFVLMLLMIVSYERPIRDFLNANHRQEAISLETAIKARQRLLNEPFFLILLDIGVWVIAALIYSLVFWVSEIGRAAVYATFFQCLQTGLITSVAAFFVTRSVLQRRPVPYLFPQGGLYMTPKTFRIRIGTRLAALMVACNLIPFFAMINTARGTYHSALESGMLLDQLRSAIFIQSLIFIAVAIVLTILVSLNLTPPFQDIIRVLQTIRDGGFHNKVRVTSNDEIGYTGDVINEMTEGLIDRDRMRRSLELVKEVQQHLLPDADPTIEGLDIAGRSKYCERTGGDYYDYLQIATPQEGRLAVVIGDVSGHGIPAALLMAAARSSIRQRGNVW